MSGNNLSPEALAILAKKKAERSAQQKGSDTPAPSHAKPAQQDADLAGFDFSDLVPNLDSSMRADAAPTVEQDAETQLDQFIASLSIAEVYKKFCGKAPIKWSGADENNMISCPHTDHEDKHPSAWFNISKKVWRCERCDDGGGIIDLVGATMGIATVHDRKNRNYHDIRREIARGYGWGVLKGADGRMVVIAPGTPARTQSSGGAFAKLLRSAPTAAPVHPAPPAEERRTEPVSEPESPGVHVEPEPKAQVLHIVPEPDDDDEGDADSFDDSGVPNLDWRKIFTQDSFIKSFMDESTRDSTVETYHLAHALVAIGMALGRNVVLADEPTVKANFNFCLLGKTGSGKSKSKAYLNRILSEVLPYEANDPTEAGVRIMGKVSTGEGFIQAFGRPMPVPQTNGKVEYRNIGWVRGVVYYPELSGLTGFAGRAGSSLKDTLLEAYDHEDGAHLSYINKTDGEVAAPYHFASVITSTQPDALPNLLGSSDKDSGFLNRWNFFIGPRKKSMSLFTQKMDFSRAKHYLEKIVTWASGSARVIEWTPEAFKAWDDFYHGTVDPMKQTSQVKILERADLTMKKLILVLTANAERDKVEVDIVQQAIMFWDYLIDCYRLVDMSVGVPERSDREEYILQVIRKWQAKTGEPMPRGELYEKISRPTMFRGVDLGEKARCIENLEKAGLVEQAKPSKPRPGRPTIHYGAIA